MIGILESVDLRSTGPVDAYLLIGELIYPDWEAEPGCEPVCGKLTLRIRDLDETLILLIDAGGSMRRGHLSDLAVGNLIRGWHTDMEYSSLPPQYDATRIELVNAPASR